MESKSKSKPRKLVVIINESLLASIIKDTVSTGSMIGLMVINHRYLSGSAWIDGIFIIMIMVWIASFNSAEIYRGSKKGAIDWLKGKR